MAELAYATDLKSVDTWYHVGSTPTCGTIIMEIITVKMIIEDKCNPSDGEAKDYVVGLICEAFGKEERQEHPRVKLILIEAEHKQ